MNTFDCGDLVWREDVKRIVLESLADMSTCPACNKEIMETAIDSIPSAESHNIFPQMDTRTLIDDIRELIRVKDMRINKLEQK